MSLINPTLENIDLYLDELMDKNGSDYHSLPVKLDRFISCTYRFLQSDMVYFDLTQSISDDIRPIIIERSDVSIIKDNGFWKVPVPSDYYRLIRLVPLVKGENLTREITIVKHGQEAYENNPFREPTFEYPTIYRMSDFFQIKTGQDVNQYDSAFLKYCKQPTFATIDELDKKIVNLSIESIIRICNDVADSFRYSTGDPSAQLVESFNSKFGKRNRS